MICPYCGAQARLFGRNVSHDCPKCGALEFGPNDRIEDLIEEGLLTEEEIRTGWYGPGTIFRC
jgi:tRNA(Ile2) C34 agmatinyltransferase TiaS